MRLLLAEDDPDLVKSLLPLLRQAGFAVDVAADGVEAQHLGETTPFDAVILDLGLPLRSGLEALSHWRARGQGMPVLVLTARDSWQDKVAGLRAGADDYLTKPFHPEELLARLQALIRRAHGRSQPVLRAGELELDEARQAIRPANGEWIQLTGTEFRLLRAFMLNPGKLLSKSQLVEHVYDQDFDRDSNVIEVYVRRLRDKIGRNRIETRRGQGYVFNE